MIDLLKLVIHQSFLPMQYFADSPKLYAANVSCYMVATSPINSVSYKQLL